MSDAGLEVRARRRVIGADLAGLIVARAGDVIVPRELARPLIEALAPLYQRAPKGFVGETLREVLLALRLAATREDARPGFAYETTAEKVLETRTGDAQAASHVDVAAAAHALGISAQAVRKRCRTGALPARQVAGRWLVDAKALPDNGRSPR